MTDPTDDQIHKMLDAYYLLFKRGIRPADPAKLAHEFFDMRQMVKEFASSQERFRKTQELASKVVNTR